MEFGFNFWELDFVGIAYDYDNDVDIHYISPETIITQDGIDMRTEVLYDDEKYYVQYEVGEEADVNFQLPEFDPERKQTYILHSKGYYDILMEPPEFRPRFSDLIKLKRPLAFTEYSKQRYLELYQHQLVNMQLKKDVDEE